MKRILKVLLIAMICLIVTGCKQTVNTAQKIDYTDIEISNVSADKRLLDKAEDIYEKNYQKTSNNLEKQVVLIKYLDDVYQIAGNRVSLDLEILDVFSDDYKNYIATMQAYSEVYLKEKDRLVANSKLIDKADLSHTDSGKMLDIIEETIDSYLR